MVDLRPQDGSGLGLRGSFEVYSVSADVAEQDVLDNLGEPVASHNNLVVVGATEILSQLMRGNAAEYLPNFISIGAGGDFNQTTKLDTGARVAPLITDTEMRFPVARIPIASTEEGSASNEWSYVAIARPHEAIAPIINEFGVETVNGSLLSHFVTQPDDDGKSEVYCKTSLEWLVIKWKFQLILNTINQLPVETAEELVARTGNLVVSSPNNNASTTSLAATAVSQSPEGVASGLYLKTQDSSGAESLTLLASDIYNSGASVTLLARNSDGTYTTLDVQANNTVAVTESDGTSYEIDLTEVI